MSLIRRIKEKVRKKIDRLRAKLKSKKPVLIISAFLVAILTGCQNIPSRAQSQTFEGCEFMFFVAGPTNCPPVVEFGTQTMAIENSGSEHLAPAQETSPQAVLNSGIAVPMTDD